MPLDPGIPLQRLQLGPLSDTSVRALANALHAGQLTEAELQVIVNRAEGNAFFAEELVVATELGGSSLPDDLASLLMVRVDQLDEDARQVVRAASCAGRQVSHELLAAVVALEPVRLDHALRDAVDSNVLVPSGTSYAFRHALLGEAVYDDLLPGERVRIHAAYVENRSELAEQNRALRDVFKKLQAEPATNDTALDTTLIQQARRILETDFDKDNGGFRISGRKVFCSQAPVADILTTMAAELLAVAALRADQCGTIGVALGATGAQ